MSSSAVRRFVIAFSSIVFLTLPLCAQGGRGGRGGGQGRSGPGNGNPDDYLVPWMFLQKSGALVGSPVVLYWLPASEAEVSRSPLLTSHSLLAASGRCVGLQIVTPDDAVTIEKLGATGKLPMAVVTDGKGKVTRTVSSVRGTLAPAAVEKALAEELRARDDSVYVDLAEARRSASAGEKTKAIDLYTRIWETRCLYPLVGSEARRGLSDLGVTVNEVVAPPPADPNLQVVKPTPPKPAHRS